QVIADFCLPYRCCDGVNTTQFVLGVIQTLWLDGVVLDKDGSPIENPKVSLNNDDLPTDKNGRFRKIIPPNTFLVLKVSADGFEPFEISITSGEENISQKVTLLKKAEIPMITISFKIADSADRPINDAEIKTDEAMVKTNNAGEAIMRVRANSKITFTISKQGFFTKTETADTQSAALNLAYNLIKIVKLSGDIKDAGNNQPIMNAQVFLNDRPIAVENNKYFVELEDSHTYSLIVTAPGKQKFVQDIPIAFDDVVQGVLMQPVKTLSVRVGVYLSPEPPRTTPIREVRAFDEMLVTRNVIKAGPPGTVSRAAASSGILRTIETARVDPRTELIIRERAAAEERARVANASAAAAAAAA